MIDRKKLYEWCSVPREKLARRGVRGRDLHRLSNCLFHAEMDPASQGYRRSVYGRMAGESGGKDFPERVLSVRVRLKNYGILHTHIYCGFFDRGTVFVQQVI